MAVIAITIEIANLCIRLPRQYRIGRTEPTTIQGIKQVYIEKCQAARNCQLAAVHRLVSRNGNSYLATNVPTRSVPTRDCMDRPTHPSQKLLIEAREGSSGSCIESLNGSSNGSPIESIVSSLVTMIATKRPRWILDPRIGVLVRCF